jgi:hypothetical protein
MYKCLYIELQTIKIHKGINWACGVAQTIECLPSKHQALSSNTSTTTKRKEQIQRQNLKQKGTVSQ